MSLIDSYLEYTFLDLKITNEYLKLETCLKKEDQQASRMNSFHEVLFAITRRAQKGSCEEPVPINVRDTSYGIIAQKSYDALRGRHLS